MEGHGFNFMVLMGVLIGVFIRTAGPYLMRWADGKVAFDPIYLRSAVLAAITGVLGGGYAIPALAPDLPWSAALWIGITTGYMWQSVLREGEKPIERNIANDIRP